KSQSLPLSFFCFLLANASSLPRKARALLVKDLGFCSFIITGPTNVTVLAGSEARFNCTVSSKWVIVIWLSNGNPVLTVVNPQGPIITSDRFTSQNYTSTSGFTLELIVHDTRLSDSGRIECSTQQGNESSSAFLWVQVNGSLFIKNSTITVKENKTVEIVCEALGWAPAPDITWMTNDTFIDKSRYVTKQSQGSNGLHNAMSILTLTPTDTEIVTCLADIEALPSPQNATITVFFLNSTVGKWMFVVPCLSSNLNYRCKTDRNLAMPVLSLCHACHILSEVSIKNCKQHLPDRPGER
uniref:Ig-like domain-containing protein n=1 Tax=Nothoprocta perdicaria TaxID=30464 RepID=A0A8C6YNR7_NOTPE